MQHDCVEYLGRKFVPIVDEPYNLAMMSPKHLRGCSSGVGAKIQVRSYMLPCTWP